MKKIIISLCAAVATVAFVACGSKNGGANFTQEEKALGDTLSLVYGQSVGVNALSQYDQVKANLPAELQDKFSKADFIRGMKAIATRDTADLAYVVGLQAGMQIWGAAKGMPSQLEVPVDAEVMLKEAINIINADSIENTYTYTMAFQQMLQRVQDYATEKKNAALEALPESIENKEKGAAYADSLVNNAGYTRAESGLVYLIEEPGTGDLVKANDRIQLRYKGMHTDGTVFDQTREEPMTSYASRFIPGFTEGLQLLGKGGKATLVIPGDLAYGVNGQGDNIGRNETLVFEIEIVDIVTK